jgi:hypothetical protein
LSDHRTNDAKEYKRDEFDGGAEPTKEIPQGTSWNYELRPAIFKRNGANHADAPSVSRDGDDPITADAYTYGSGSEQVGIKYVAVHYGLDYVRNLQSNANLYG